MALSTGDQLGPYEILSPIGAGGMGEVYKARDTRLERYVAVKVLPAALTDSPLARERLQREARRVSQALPSSCQRLDGHQSYACSSRFLDFSTEVFDRPVLQHLDRTNATTHRCRGLLDTQVGDGTQQEYLALRRG